MRLPEYQPGALKQLFDLVQSIPPLVMGFCILPVQLSCTFTCCSFPDKQSQIILVDLLIFIILIVPDKTAVSSVFRDRAVSHDFAVFIVCVKIKKKNAARIQIIVDKAEHLS